MKKQDGCPCFSERFREPYLREISMELRQLRYFVTVVEEKTVTAAAEKLNMTQPPLTAQLKLLEKELNCSLFQRKGRRLQVTEAGKHFYQKAPALWTTRRTPLCAKRCVLFPVTLPYLSYPSEPPACSTRIRF